MASRGKTLHVVGIGSFPPKRRRLQLLWDIQPGAYKTWDFVRLVRVIQRELNSKLLIIWDRLPGHRAAERFLESEKIQVEYVPAYAPELNPVEWVWAHAKYADLANWVPDDTEDLED